MKAFNNGEECIKCMDMNPDLVIVDFFLQVAGSQLTGLDVMKKILEINPSTPVVFLSGNDDETTINEAIAAGAKRYILKNGYFIDNLTECVSELLGN
jgi:DNA-binding NarL/FixJ family response regulator